MVAGFADYARAGAPRPPRPAGPRGRRGRPGLPGRHGGEGRPRAFNGWTDGASTAFVEDCRTRGLCLGAGRLAPGRGPRTPGADRPRSRGRARRCLRWRPGRRRVDTERVRALVRARGVQPTAGFLPDRALTDRAKGRARRESTHMAWEFDARHQGMDTARADRRGPGTGPVAGAADDQVDGRAPLRARRRSGRRRGLHPWASERLSSRRLQTPSSG